MAEDESLNSPIDENCSTLNLQVFVCSICGDDHDTENCAVVTGLKQIYDSKVLSRARQTLPKNLSVKTLVDGTTTVVTSAKIEQGTQFGPFQAPLSLDLPPSVIFPFKVFGQSLDEGYYLDTTDEESCNWMCLVATATTTRDQNLICYDMKQSIYFATTREVLPGEELRLWYALYYGLKLQALPLADDSSHEESLPDLHNNELEDKSKQIIEEGVNQGENLLDALTQHLPAHVLGASGERDVWFCKLCAAQETNVAQYARHLMTHYRPPMHNSHHPQCKICQKHFFSKKVFEKHMSRVHNCTENVGAAIHPSITEEKLQSEAKQLLDQSETETTLQNESIDEKYCETKCLAMDFIRGWNEGDKKILQVHSSEKGSSVLTSNPEDLKCRSVSEDSNQNIQESSHSASEESRTSWGSEAEIIKNPNPSSEVNYVSSFTNSIDSDQLTQPSDVNEFDLSNIRKEQDIFPVSYFNGQQLIITTNNDLGFSSSCNLHEVQKIDETFETEGAIKLIMVESCNENDGSMTVVDESAADLQVIHGSASLPEEELDSLVASHEHSDQSLVEHSATPYSCDICQKSFGKCSYLYRHLRKHTGEFTCATCLAVFARKENLKTHSCSQPKEWYPCPTCGKKFSAKKYLQRHAPMHTGQYMCSDCKRQFVSRLSLKFHRCNSKLTERTAVTCVLCKCVFDSECKLRAHLKVHTSSKSEIKTAGTSKLPIGKTKISQRQIKVDQKTISPDSTCNESSEGKVFICEVCGATFKSLSSMKTHRFCHGERKFECEVCKKRFHRKDVLQEHLRVHQEANFPCSVCGKKYKTKKSLYVHSLIHGGLKRFSCGVCEKGFFQKGNLLKHMQTHTSERLYSCQYCDKSFSSKEYFNIHELTHTQGKIYKCNECNRSFVKKHLLDTHRQIFHSNKGFLCKFCNTVIRHRHSIRRHLEKCHTDHCQEWSLPGFIDQLQADLPPSLLSIVGETKLTPKKQQERQQLLESLRKKHFQSMSEKSLGKTQSLSDCDYSSKILSSHVTQEDPLLMFPSHQLALVENFVPDYDHSQASGSGCQSLMISGDIKAPEGEILLTLVNQGEPTTSSPANETSVLTSAALGGDMIGLDSGTTFMMEDEDGTNSVLLYVVETSNGEEGDDEDLVWCCDSVGDQL